MKQLTLYPGAKINIGLYVFEKREDGFHELESIFYPVGPDNSNLEPDKLTVSVCENQNEETLFYTENYAEKVRMIECGLDYPGTPQDNICVKAYEMLDADYQLPPAVIVLEKHIPVGAGLGGGSSDGVSTLKALSVMSSRLPTGVGTIYNMPIIGGKYTPIHRNGKIIPSILHFSNILHSIVG